MLRNPSLLATFTQFPHDPTSGAARSVRTTCEFLANAGWSVEALGTTATEGRLSVDPEVFLRSAGIALAIHVGPAGSRVLRFVSRRVAYSLIDLGPANAADSRQVSGDAFDQLFDVIFERCRPSVFLTYSGWLPEFSRRTRARQRGARVVFTPRNPVYVSPAGFEGADRVFCATRFMAEIARERLGLLPAVLPVPVAAEDTVAPVRQPAFAGFINPEPSKGIAVLARIIEQVSKRHPGIPFLIVSSRQRGEILASIARLGGLDLQNANVLLAEPVANPASLFAVVRVLLVPSLDEPAGRVAAEALVNGVPPLVSDRGGLPEVVGDPAFVIPISPAITSKSWAPPPPCEVNQWVERIIHLMSDERAYQEAAERARVAAQRYAESRLVAIYDAFFRDALAD